MFSTESKEVWIAAYNSALIGYSNAVFTARTGSDINFVNELAIRSADLALEAFLLKFKEANL